MPGGPVINASNRNPIDWVPNCDVAGHVKIPYTYARRA
jgi:hypothetical protein